MARKQAQRNSVLFWRHGRRALVLGGLLFVAVSTAADTPPAGVSDEEWASIQTQIETDHLKITESDQPGAIYRADSSSQRFTAHFGPENLTIAPRGHGEPAWQLDLQLTAWGAAHDLKQVNFASVTSEANRVEYRRGALTEWYVNKPMGLEQGFTIEAPPDDDITELVLEMTISGDLTAELAESGQAVTFRQEDSATHLTYSGLKAWDAVDAPLEARMELAGGGTRLRLVVGVAGAAWPVVVDPIFNQVAKLLPVGDLDSTGVGFGQSVAADGDLVVIGSCEPVYGYFSGAAYVFQQDVDGLEMVAKLIASDGSIGADFSNAVAISGDTVIIGARGDRPNGPDSGSAYVFQQNHGGPNVWGEVRKIVAADGGQGDRLGDSVAISGDYVAVGETGSNSGTGSIYVFQRDQGGPNAWGQVARIFDDGSANGTFATSLSMSGDSILVGAKLGNGVVPGTGSAYVFQRDEGGPNNWGQAVTLIAPDGEQSDQFGSTVAIDQNTAIVSAPARDPHSIYVFKRDDSGSGTWVYDTTIVFYNNGVSVFGSSLAIRGDTVVVGDHLYWASYFFMPGGAHVFERNHGGPNAWGHVTTLVGFDVGNYESFGWSVALTDDRVVVGTPGHEHSHQGSGAGSTFLFERDAGGPNSWGMIEEQECPPVRVAWEEYFGVGEIGIDTAVIGVGADDDQGYFSGSAYFFKLSGGSSGSWNLLKKVVLPDGEENDTFGASESIDGDIVIVTAPGDGVNGISSGSAYVFQRNHEGPDNWGNVAVITPSDGGPRDRFGSCVSLSGDTAIISAAYDQPNGERSGSAYVFRVNPGGFDSWEQVAKIAPVDGSEDDLFGLSCSISGDTAVVGAQYDDDNGTNTGSAYVFQRDHGGLDSWGQVTKVVPTDATEEDRFGRSVAIDGDTFIVGAHYGESAYLYQRDHGGPNSWGQITKITPEPGAGNSGFGRSVSINGKTALVGAPSDRVVYLFRQDHGGANEWGQVAKIFSGDGEAGDSFGTSVSVNGSLALIGATARDDLGLDSGAAYIFTLSDAFFADGFELGDTSAWSVTVP